MAAPKPVGIWIRVSTEFQVGKDSPEHHAQRARQFIKLKEWNEVAIYRLEAVSGKKIIDHPEAQRMLHDVKTGKISGLVFSNLSRLARNTKELLEIAEVFKAHNADLTAIDQAIDTSTPAGNLLFTFMSGLAQFEREEIAKRVKASVPIRAKLGKPLGGQAPYGYQWKDKKLELNPNESPIRKLMFELFTEHRRKRAVCRILNEQGHRTRKGSKFGPTTLVRLLQDPIAKGLRRSNYTESTGDKKKWKLKPKDEWVFTKAPAIVSEELWETVNKILDEQYANRTKRGKTTRHLFSGYTFCHCDESSKMYPITKSPKYVCQKCRNKIPAEILEEIFVSQAKQFFFNKSEVKKYIQTGESKISHNQQILQNLTKQSTELTEKLNKLLELHQEGQIPTDAFKEHYTPPYEQLQQIKQRIPELQAEIDYLKINAINVDQAIVDAQQVTSNWEHLEFTSKRSIVESMVKNIVVGEGELTINLINLPTISDTAPLLNHSKKVLNPHGFILATKTKDAG